jgi:hypothetical protein
MFLFICTRQFTAYFPATDAAPGPDDPHRRKTHPHQRVDDRGGMPNQVDEAGLVKPVVGRS